MSNPLDQLHEREAALLAALPRRGYFEQLAPLIEEEGLPEKWIQVLREYVGLLDDPAVRLEALRRAVFLVWYWWNEPWQLTGMRDRSPELEFRVLEALETEMLSSVPDRELRSMLGGYGEGLPFDQHPEFGATLASVAGSPGLDSRLPLLNLKSRGSMGAYWLSRNDLPNKPPRPTSRGEVEVE